jgi:hypothetical protein
MSIKTKYEKVCNIYVKIFCEKQEFDFDDIHWAGGIVGSWVIIGDFSFNFHDIVWDVNSEQPKGKIIEWYNYTLSANPTEVINYFSYCKQN